MRYYKLPGNVTKCEVGGGSGLRVSIEQDPNTSASATI